MKQENIPLTLTVLIASIISIFFFKGYNVAAKYLIKIISFVKKRSQLNISPIALSTYAISLSYSTLMWLFPSVSLLILQHSLNLGLSLTFIDCIFLCTTSYLVGFLTFFSPGGLGAREGTLALLLTLMFNASIEQAIVLSLLARVSTVLADLILGLIASFRINQLHVNQK